METTKRAINYPSWIANSLLLLTDIYIDKTDLLNAEATSRAVIENFKNEPNLISKAESNLDLIENIKAKKKGLLIESDTIEFQNLDKANAK